MTPNIIELKEPSPDTGWMCRSCACVLRFHYKYPPSPWSYCSQCRSALSVQEQLVAVARLHLNRNVAPALATAAQPIPTSTTPNKPLMSITEVAAFFGKKNQAIYKMIERGQLAGATRVGRRLYVRRADLLRSLAEGRVPSPGRSR